MRSRVEGLDRAAEALDPEREAVHYPVEGGCPADGVATTGACTVAVCAI